MDRKTLLAFILIALVLILTPSYMELVSPGYSDAQTNTVFQAEEPSTGPSRVRLNDKQPGATLSPTPRKASSKTSSLKTIITQQP